jgi:hypothetical protein
MAKKKRKKKLPPELGQAFDERSRETLRRLQERIAYHRAKLAEEQAARQAS